MAALVHLDDVDTFPGGDQVITVTFGGRTFRAGRRTAAHIEATLEAFERRFPDLALHLAQPCYNTGVEASAGTHDGDGVLDWVVTWKSGRAVTRSVWWTVQLFFRNQGWDAWFRHTGTWADPSDWHFHVISEGCPGPVGDFIPYQDWAYKAHRLGFARSADGPDGSRFPTDILARRFDYEAWEEDHMTPEQEDRIASKAAEKTVALLLKTDIGDKTKLTVEQILNKAKTSLLRK